MAEPLNEILATLKQANTLLGEIKAASKPTLREQWQFRKLTAGATATILPFGLIPDYWIVYAEYNAAPQFVTIAEGADTGLAATGADSTSFRIRTGHFIKFPATKNTLTIIATGAATVYVWAAGRDVDIFAGYLAV